MTDFAAWLDTAITTREQLAQAVAYPADWHQGSDDDEWESPELVCMWPPEFHTPYEQDKHWRGLTAHDEQLAAHIAANDPAAVLRRCAADRKLLELHGGRAHACPVIDTDGDLDERANLYDHEVCPVVQLLAEGYGWTA